MLGYCKELRRGRALSRPLRLTILFVDVDIFKQIAAEWINAEILHLGTNRLLDDLMGNRQPGCLLLEHDLSLFIQLCSLSLVRGQFGGLDQFFKVLVAPVGAIAAANGLAAQKGRKKIVRIGNAARPSENNRAVPVLFQ